MSTPFLSEIRIMAFGFAPMGWARCDGQVLPKNQNQALYALIGNTYGGGGATFALPDLRTRTAIHWGSGYNLGQSGGEGNHQLTVAEIPAHRHTVVGTTSVADSPIPTANYLGAADNLYGPLANQTTLPPLTVTNSGGTASHSNEQPMLVLNFCIAVQGKIPS